MREIYASMQKRHFETIATIIRTFPTSVMRGVVAQRFANELGATNGNFDKDRFIAACIKEEK